MHHEGLERTNTICISIVNFVQGATYKAYDKLWGYSLFLPQAY